MVKGPPRLLWQKPYSQRPAEGAFMTFYLPARYQPFGFRGLRRGRIAIYQNRHLSRFAPYFRSGDLHPRMHTLRAIVLHLDRFGTDTDRAELHLQGSCCAIDPLNDLLG
jgi:hypothetical protein